MEKEQEVHLLIIDSNEDIGHFDADICEDILPTSKEIPAENGNEVLLTQIEMEIEKSKTNFFNVEVIEQENRPAPIQSKQQKKKTKVTNSIIMEGYIEKKYESNIFFKWNNRYAVLTTHKLYLFENNSRKKVLGCFNFKILPAQIKPKSDDTIIKISFFGQCQQLIIRAPNNGIKNKWYKHLQTVISCHSKQTKLLVKTNLKSLYEDADTITEQDLIKSAETGDILLFHTDHTAGKFQRFFTQSEFDHVAMVIRLNGQLMVFEANRNDGVELYNWKRFIKYFNLYKKVSYRKLKCWRKKQLHHSLLSFARKNIGRKFDIGAYKLLLKQESNFDWNEQKERGYFCSQLIAKALKSIGLLQPLRACSRYWPVDFSQNGKMKLIGASLGHQQAILLNKHIKYN